MVRAVDALHAVGAFFHHAAHADRDFGVEHHPLDLVDRLELLLVGNVQIRLGPVCRGSWL